ncbi:MAG: GspE/PulE family protein [Planctomycetota bacterium]|jgi:type II secretory ATPase GspE/PulE/Tfp pilus assembly ATPase PilB-like protein
MFLLMQPNLFGLIAFMELNEIVCAIQFNFSWVKLLLLIGWVYLCLYTAYRIQFSTLVSKERREIASFFGIFLGPILLLILIFMTVMHRKEENGGSTLELLKEQFLSMTRKISFSSGKGDMMIELLDSSGRNISDIYGHGSSGKVDQILDLTKQIIFDALEEEASDILIDPKGNSNYAVRFRMDGVLSTVDEFDADTCQAVLNSIKAVSNMDISEKRRPQDGAFMADTINGKVSFRVSSAGAVHGEKLSIRILRQTASHFSLDSVGLSAKQRVVIEREIARPSSMILLCGPTGSGKTTSLYAMLNEIDLFTRNVITVEDPVEYVLDNASQIEVNPKAGITFGKTLRSILRQDPDVICVGEIRDEETAATALRASQTGHLVLATLHCNSNAAAIVRLLDLGVSSLLISSGLNLLISQRLLRKLCDECKVNAELSINQKKEFMKKKVNFHSVFQAVGCDNCRGTGYRGRTAIFDMLVLTDEIKNQITSNQALIEEMRKSGDKKGQSNLYKQGLKKVVSGETSLEELKRVVG